jgi:hypothetical protein
MELLEGWGTNPGPAIEFVKVSTKDALALGLGDEIFEGHRITFHVHLERSGRVVIVASMIYPLPAEVVAVGLRWIPPGADEAVEDRSARICHLTLGPAGLRDLVRVLGDERAQLRT